jgi:hypothetical protein
VRSASAYRVRMMFAAADECRPTDPGKLLEKIYADT